MKRSLLRLCQSREKAAVSSPYQGVVCEADAASVASQDVFKVRAEGAAVPRAGGECEGTASGLPEAPRPAWEWDKMVPKNGARVRASGRGRVKAESEVGEGEMGLRRQPCGLGGSYVPEALSAGTLVSGAVREEL